MGIVRFLNDRYDEIEDRARKATQGKWKLWGMLVMADQDGTSNVNTTAEVAHTYSHPAMPPRTWNATHIVHNDPSYVLADITAKRRIMEEMSFDGLGPREWLLRVLVQPFQDHPDLDEEWRV